MATPIKLKCIVSSITNHSDEVSTLTLTPSKRLPNFQPGQFLHLALDPFDPSVGFWPESRVFSIASAPFDPELSIAYAVKGAFTKRMREELSVGKEIWLRLPYGHFTLSATQDEEIILVAGGTGITPFISFLRKEIHKPSGISLKLLYGVREPELFLFTDTLTEAQSQLNAFKLTAFCEGGSNNYPYFPVNPGSLSLDKICQATDKIHNATFYLAGPAAMINAFKTGLTGMGINHNRIRVDEWE